MLYCSHMKSVARRGHKTGNKSQTAPAIINRRASYDYNLSDKLVVGLELTGAETKAARLNHVSLRGAYVVPKLNRATGRNELYLINASFTLANNVPRGSGQSKTTVDTRARRILAKRREIERMCDNKKEGMTIVPTKLLTHGHYVKLEIAMGKGKKQYDKRESIRRRDSQREVGAMVKRYRA